MTAASIAWSCGDSVSGADAAAIGLMMKAVPAEILEAEVEHLARRLCKIDPDLWAANQRIINLGLELMGAHVTRPDTDTKPEEP